MNSTTRALSLELIRASIRFAPDARAIRELLASRALDWNDLFYVADTHALTPFLHKTWQSLNLESLISDDSRSYLAQTYRDNQTRYAHARDELLEIWNLLADNKIPALVLKGLPLIDSLYADPALRFLNDADFLIDTPEHAHAGLELLLARGFEFVPAKSHAFNTKHLSSVWRLNGFQRRGYLFDPAQPRPVELHVTLWDDAWRGLRVRHLADLWERARKIEFDDTTLRVLSFADSFIHVCVHLATHVVEREARLIQALDVALFAQRYANELDWTRVLRTAEFARVARFVYLALYAAHALFGSPLPPTDAFEKIRALTPKNFRTYAEREAADDLLQMDFRHVDLAQAYRLTFAATQNVREKIRVARFAFLPPRHVLSAQYDTPPYAFGIPLYTRHIWDRGRAYLQSRVSNL